MPATDSDEPKFLHRVEYAVYRMIEGIVALVPMDSCAVLGRHLGRLFQFSSPRYRKLVRRNLRIATADRPLDASELDELINETFRRAGANFICSLRSASIPAGELAACVEASSCELLSREDFGRGLVVAMPHMGNWEILTKMRCLYPDLKRFGGVYRPLNNPLIDQLTHGRRTADGCQLFSRRDGFHAPIALLRSPGIMGVLADQRAGTGGVVLPFFGKLTSCTPLPDLMARRAKADVSALTISTTGDGQWRADLKLLEDSPGIEGIMQALEKAMRASLPDVFWFHDRWRTDRYQPLRFFTKFDPEIANHATVPLRVLLTMPDDSQEDADELINAMLNKRPDLRIDWLTALPGKHPDPRVIKHDWDHSAPEEHADGALDRIDASYPTPLDAALLFGGTLVLAKAARRAGLKSILGIRVQGKPWTRTVEPPLAQGGWARVAADISDKPLSTNS